MEAESLKEQPGTKFEPVLRVFLSYDYIWMLALVFILIYHV